MLLIMNVRRRGIDAFMRHAFLKIFLVRMFCFNNLFIPLKSSEAAFLIRQL